MSFMSTAPRPQTQPSAISPANGSWVQSVASAGTTSRWPCTSRPGRLVSSPSNRATTLVRRSADSQNGGLEADLGELLGDVLRRLPLPRAAAVAVVRRVDADQVAAEVDDLVLRARDVGAGSARVPPRSRVAGILPQRRGRMRDGRRPPRGVRGPPGLLRLLPHSGAGPPAR